MDYFALSASMLSHTVLEIIVMLEMGKEKGIDMSAYEQRIEKDFRDFIALGAGEQSFRSMSEVSKGLFWNLRNKVANDENSFEEVLKRTKQREESLLQERDSYLAGD